MQNSTGVPTWLKWVIIVETSLVVLLITLFVILSVAGVSFKQEPITSYDACVLAKGSIIQESYPARCITSNGQTFIQAEVSPQPESSSND
jgi:hypothetical protein